MDAVKLDLHVDVAVQPKLMGSEGFSRSGDVEHRNDRVSLMVTHSSSIDNENETQLCNSTSQLPHLKGEELSKNMPAGNEKNCLIISSTLEGVPLQRKAAKVNKSSSSCSKRARVSQSEDSANPNGIEESNPEKSQLQKQKSNANKRADKRSFKVPSAKSKFESSSMKMGPPSFSSASGGNNFFGLYGLKHDFRDVTKLMDEPPLDELLKGTFAHPNFGKDKVKRTSSLNESFMNSVRKACSILHSPKSVHSQNTAEMDCSSNKMSPYELSAVCAVESVGNVEKDQSCTKDMSSCLKDPCSETESIASPLDFPLSQPKDVFERIAIHPFQDLDSLLLDVSKLAVTTKSTNDLRSGKQASRMPSLPSFPWLHSFGGHSRTNSDTVKLSTSRSTCQGKWARIGVITTFTDIDRSCFINLDSFSYDPNLVPSTGSSGNKLLPPLFPNLSSCQWDSSSPVTCKDSQFNAELGGQVDTKENDVLCPRVIVAARTLCDLATQSPRQNSFGVLRWERKTSHKAMKTCNFKSNEKLEEKPSIPISVIRSDVVSRNVGQTMPSKKPRLTIVENKNSSHSNNFKKGLCSWSTSKSSRSSPNKPVRVSTEEGKPTTTSVLKQHCMMPPPARDLGKAAYVGQQQVGKLVLTDWKRGRDK
ncbi:hypothetical protein Lalb_Chr05g0224451 [Lupinus albus]|uniref:Uncharacterized protein n=1 Tax=Lupinus albus TaxID=3870 RepID=A0A6A4QI50_LUPAL|nr:hypothetical protein Lalb_Chr05g0224451 [Lupinus albus]